MEQLEFDFLKEYEENNFRYIIYNEENKIYPFNIFFKSEKEALNYLNTRIKDQSYFGGVSYHYEIHKFMKNL